MTINRRRFIKNSACISATSALAIANTAEGSTNSTISSDKKFPIFVATWPFGKVACEKAVEVAQKTGSVLDGIEQGIWVTENDAKNASVGIGGTPNAKGDVELDACIMSGPDHGAGSVAGIQSILHPISVARLVMEKTPHVMLVGEGAKQFALEHGHPETNLLTDKQKVRWHEWKAKQAEDKKQNNEDVSTTLPEINEDHHDTIAMVGVDENGNIFGGCSTSGWGYKLPGRVGDSPIIGSGLYVDNKVGAAGATGLGENVMRHCGSFLVVEMMRNGASPTDACEMAIRRIAELDPKNLANLSITFVAINKKGEFGAAGTNQGFKFGVATPTESSVEKGRALSDKKIGPEGGNRK